MVSFLHRAAPAGLHPLGEPSGKGLPPSEGDGGRAASSVICNSELKQN